MSVTMRASVVQGDQTFEEIGSGWIHIFRCPLESAPII